MPLHKHIKPRKSESLADFFVRTQEERGADKDDINAYVKHRNMPKLSKASRAYLLGVADTRTIDRYDQMYDRENES